VWRVALSPRWLAWHLLAILAVAGCAVAAAWQWGRAGSAMGSALNVGYGVQWPIFAVFFLYMWWRFLRLDLVAAREQRAQEAPVPDVARAVVEAEPAPVDPAPWDRARSPFTRTPLPREAPASEQEAPALAEYNRMLAQLDARDREPR